MSKEIEELMQKRIISENTELTNMLVDIVPLKENRFTDLEIEANKKEEFSIVIYKKENPILRFFKNVKFGLEKLKIIRHSKEFNLAKINVDKNI
jgi:hypothetical protein